MFSETSGDSRLSSLKLMMIVDCGRVSGQLMVCPTLLQAAPSCSEPRVFTVQHSTLVMLRRCLGLVLLNIKFGQSKLYKSIMLRASPKNVQKTYLKYGIFVDPQYRFSWVK